MISTSPFPSVIVLVSTIAFPSPSVLLGLLDSPFCCISPPCSEPLIFSSL